MLGDHKNIVWLGLALMLLIMTGCQSTESYYRGYKAASESTAPLIAATNQQGAWKTFDIVLDYQYGYAGDVLDISGTIDLGFYYEINTTSIISLDVYLFFLDDKAKVMETAFLARLLEFRPEETLAFAKKLKVPPGTEAIAFGYNGRARRDENGGHGFIGRDGIGSEYFYDLPKRVKM